MLHTLLVLKLLLSNFRLVIKSCFHLLKINLSVHHETINLFLLLLKSLQHQFQSFMVLSAAHLTGLVNFINFIWFLVLLSLNGVHVFLSCEYLLFDIGHLLLDHPQ